RLAQHPRSQVRLAAQVRPNELYSDDAVDQHMARSVDNAHAAFADAGFEAITPCNYAPQHRVCRLRRLSNSLCHSRSAPLGTSGPRLQHKDRISLHRLLKRGITLVPEPALKR